MIKVICKEGQKIPLKAGTVELVLEYLSSKEVGFRFEPKHVWNAPYRPSQRTRNRILEVIRELTAVKVLEKVSAGNYELSMEVPTDISIDYSKYSVLTKLAMAMDSAKEIGWCFSDGIIGLKPLQL